MVGDAIHWLAWLLGVAIGLGLLLSVLAQLARR